MMFVIGDSEPAAETTGLVEEIVRAQVVEMLTQATAQASKRGSKSISVDDLIFLIRHDRAKVSRLRTYLSWKDVRKNAKDTDGGADGTELLEDGAQADAKLKYKKARVGLPWDLNSMFTEQVPEREDEEDDEETEANYATMQRLKNADERTRSMSKDEYVHWSECRQASFTYRKSKRFREWTQMSTWTESRPGDDIVDILGFLSFEMVASITEEALKVKALEGDDEAEGQARKRHKPAAERTLFDGPEEERAPLAVKHIEEAFRRLQVPSRRHTAIRNFHGGRFRKRIILI